MIKKSDYHKKKRVDGKTKYEKICVYCGKEVVYFHGKKPSVCPHCGSLDYIKPPTETHLFLLQKKYLENGNQHYLDKMFEVLQVYAVSIIKKMLPRDFKSHYDKVDEKAHDAASLLIVDYLTHPIGEYVIEASFGGYLRKKAQQVMWNKKLQNEERHDSLNRVIDPSSDSDKEMLSISEIMNIEPLYGTTNDHVNDSYNDKIDISDGIFSIIDSIISTIKQEYGYVVALQTLYGISIRIDKGNNHDMNEYYHLFGSVLKDLIDKSMLMVYQYIKDME